MQSFRLSRKARTSALLLLGASALGLGLTHRVSAQETVGGGSLVSPASGPIPLASAPTNPLIPGGMGPSYGLGGPNMVLVKNWDFGTNGNIKNYDDMSREFFYHDQYGNVANGAYGASSTAPDFQDSVYNGDASQPIEGMDNILGNSSNPLPAVRSFTADSLMTYLKPTYWGDNAGNEYPSQLNQVASGSFMAKWRLPAGGQLLGQDIVWETRVRYKTPPEFWFALWASGSTEELGAEADVVESWPVLDDFTNNLHTGKYWHSNMVPQKPYENGDTDLVNDLFQYGDFNQTMSNLPVPITSYDASAYHIWTWVYHRDDTYQMYVDGRLCQQNSSSTTYPWTANAVPVIATPIDQRRQPGALSDLEFRFDPTWGHNGGDYNFSQQEGQPEPASSFTGTNYEFNYSRVYLSAGTEPVGTVPVAEGAYNAQPYVAGTPPLPGTTPSIPCTIAASDYDTGGEGSGYHVFPDPNAGGSGYRVDNKHIYASSSPGGNGEVLGWNIPNDWYKYTVTLPKPAHDSAVVVVASFEVNSYNQGGGTFHLEDENGNDLSGKMVVPATNAPNPWVVITSQPFSLSAAVNPATGASGTHTLRLVMDTSGTGSTYVCDFSWMHLDYASTLAGDNVTPNNLANSNFTTPVLYNNSDGYVTGLPENIYDVKSWYIYNPTGNGWPMGSWTFSGNAGMAGTSGDGKLWSAPFLPVNPAGSPPPPAGSPQYQHQYAFLQSPIVANSGGGVINGVAGGTAGSMSQTLYFAPGTYSITFEAAQQYQADYGNSNEPVQVELDGGSAAGGQNLGAPIFPALGSWGALYSAKNSPAVTWSVPSFTVGSGGIPAGLHTITLAATNNVSYYRYETFIANVQLNYIPAPPTGPTVAQGSFEYPRVLIPNDATLIPSSDSRLASSGWIFAGGSGITITNGKYGNPACPDGTQAALLYSGGSVSQTITFPKDGYYSITFLAADAYYENPGHPLQVLVDGNLAGTVSPVPNVFGSSTFSFPIVTGTPNAPSNHTISFQGANDGNTGYNTFVDKVSLTTAAAPVVTQGSFENPPVLGSDPTYISSGDPRLNTSGWSFAGVSGIIQTSGKLGNPNFSPDGSQVAYVEPGGTVSQSIPFATGGYYTLTLQEAEIYYDSLQTDGTTHAVQVLVDGALAGTFNPGRGGYSQGTFPLGFLAAGSHTIQLQGSSTDGSWFRDFIDSVAIAPAAGPMAGAVFSNSGAAQATHLASFGRITPLTASAYRALAAAAPANPPSAAFDTKASTFFDYAQSSGGYVGLTLTAARSVSKISYAPRVGYEKRMVGGVFEGSNTSATAGYTTLATVTATPKDGTGNTLSVTNHTAYKWLRYRGPSSGYCDVAEIQLLH